jgi:hypothetical protein
MKTVRTSNLNYVSKPWKMQLYLYVHNCSFNVMLQRYLHHDFNNMVFKTEHKLDKNKILK